MDTVLVDTGIWFAIFDPRDERFSEGKDKAELLEILQVAIPWPTMYETLRTRFVKNAIALYEFERYLKSAAVTLLDDVDYRDAAIELAFTSSLRKKRPLSMVDCLIRLLIEDTNVDVKYLATFNERDFIDVCRHRGVEII